MSESQDQPGPAPYGAQATAAPPEATTTISCSRGLADWLAVNDVSFALTSYQSGRLYLVGHQEGSVVSFHERRFERAMGVTGDAQRLFLATHFQIWRMENILAPGQRIDQFDANYVPRNAHTTGDVDMHEIGVEATGRVIFVNTKYSCLATPSVTHSFKPVWKPPFISRLAPEDRCHLNGLAMHEGAARYVTAVCRSDIVTGWRDRRAEGGCIVDVQTNEIVTDRLSMPHSPRVHDGRLWVLNSGRGELATVDPHTGETETVAFLPGFLRGLAFHGRFAFVGLSLPRDGSFSGLALDGELARRDADPWCGVLIVDTASGDIVQWIRFEGEIRELFDVCVMPGIKTPMALGLHDPLIHSLITIEDWDDADRPQEAGD